jgi:hypothetical protein
MSDLNHIFTPSYFPASIQLCAAAVCSERRSDGAMGTAFRVRDRFAEPRVAAQISVAVFIDGDGCLTDLAAKKDSRCKREAA